MVCIKLPCKANKLNVAITGARGMLAYAFITRFASNFLSVYPFSKKEIDISSLRDLENIPSDTDILINLAAYTDVNKAETEIEKAFSTNKDGVFNLCKYCKMKGIFLVHISTDYIFDGKKRTPYEEEDPPNPLNVYGRSKLEGEYIIKNAGIRFLIVRLQWLFGPRGDNFIKKVLHNMKKNKSVKIVEDQVGTPTYTFDAAEAIFNLIECEAEGVFHFSMQEEASWYDVACYVKNVIVNLRKDFCNVDILPIKTPKDSLPRRPSYSVLSAKKYIEITKKRPRSWKEGIKDYIINFQEELI